MIYKFVVERYKDEEFKTLSENGGLSLTTALELFKTFTVHNKNGYLLDGSGHPIEYEVDGAEISCWIDYDE